MYTVYEKINIAHAQLDDRSHRGFNRMIFTPSPFEMGTESPKFIGRPTKKGWILDSTGYLPPQGHMATATDATIMSAEFDFFIFTARCLPK